MIELKGSEKQIAWAEKIRNEKMTEMKDHYYHPDDLPRMKRIRPDDYEKHMAALDTLENVIESVSWWIDRRDENISLILKDIKAGRI